MAEEASDVAFIKTEDVQQEENVIIHSDHPDPTDTEIQEEHSAEAIHDIVVGVEPLLQPSPTAAATAAETETSVTTTGPPDHPPALPDHPPALPDHPPAHAPSETNSLKRDAVAPPLGLLEDSDFDPKNANKRRRKSAQPPKKLNNEQWEMMFERLVKYKDMHGDCLVPKRYQEDPKLGTWVETQRVQYKKLQQNAETGGPITPNNRLNPERLSRLEGIGFAWSAKNLRKTKQTAPAATKRPPPDAAYNRAAARQRLNDIQWNEMYDRLVAYRERHGDCLVPKKYEDDTKLATWVETQRVLYNRDSRVGSQQHKLPNPHLDGSPQPWHHSAKTPEEWAAEMARAPTTATAEDAAEVAATMADTTMAEATMAVVNEVAPPISDEMHTHTGLEDPDEAGVPIDGPIDHEIPDHHHHDHNPEDVDAIAAAAEMAAVAAVESHQHHDPMELQLEKVPVKRLSEERKAKLDAIGFVWSLRSKRVDDHWDEMFRQLEQYKEEHGDCLVPSRYYQNYKLGKWVETQRYEYTKLQRIASGAEGDKKMPSNPRLTEDRRRRLESIGFEWKVKHKMKKYYDRQWDAMYEKLLAFRADNGHCLVPKRYPPDVKLGTWVHTQRIQYRKMMQGTANASAQPTEEGSKSSSEEMYFRLTEDRRRRLEHAGFVWSARDSEKTAEPARITRNSYDDQWDNMFKRLEAYKEKHGNCLVPKRCKEDPKLGTWVDTQRVQYKKMRKKLEKEGIQYVPPSLLGDASPAADRKPLVGRLTDDRIRRLEAMGFVWSIRDDWIKHYNELIEYKKEHGHCNVPARYAKNRRLGIFVSAQRQQYKNLHASIDPETGRPKKASPLTQERIDMLNALGFTWIIRSRDSLGENWNQRFEELMAYKQEHNNCLVPARYPPNPELGIWVGTQRAQYRLFQQQKKNDQPPNHSVSMTDERIRQLEELGFVWALRSDSTDTVWRRRISELREFRTHHGHCAVPGSYSGNPYAEQKISPDLGEWAAQIRQAYLMREQDKEGLLDNEKIAELDALGFLWEEPSSEIAEAVNREAMIAKDSNALMEGHQHQHQQAPLPEVGGHGGVDADQIDFVTDSRVADSNAGLPPNDTVAMDVAAAAEQAAATILNEAIEPTQI